MHALEAKKNQKLFKDPKHGFRIHKLYIKTH